MKVRDVPSLPFGDLSLNITEATSIIIPHGTATRKGELSAIGARCNDGYDVSFVAAQPEQ